MYYIKIVGPSIAYPNTHVTLSGGMWLNPLIRYTFGLPTTLAFFIADIWNSHIVLFLLALVIGALVGTGVGYLVDKYKRVL